MCIALISTAHPLYSLILIDNRDEFLNRPTAKAAWWPAPHSDVLGGRDLLRPIQGTWLGITKSGKVAVLTNYREDQPPDPNAISRGAIIRKFLTEDVGTTEDFVRDVVDTGIARDAGGFSLVCGRVGEKLAVISNRADDQADVPWIAGDVVQTVGLSNAAFLDRSWEKVTRGEELMLAAIKSTAKHGEDEGSLINRLLSVLSNDTLQRQGGFEEGGLETYMTELRKTIRVPPIGRQNMAGLGEGEMRAARNGEKVAVLDGEDKLQPTRLGVDGVYATQKQTVILVRRDGRVKFFERTLFDEQSERVKEGLGDVDVEFVLQP